MPRDTATQTDPRKDLMASRDHAPAADAALAQLDAPKTVCDFGCSAVNACSGKCQPPIRKFSNKRCKWCEAGNLRRDDEHWIVKSLSPPTIDIRKCAAVA